MKSVKNNEGVNTDELKQDRERVKLVVKEMNAAVFEWNHKTGAFYTTDAYNNYCISQINPDDILNNKGPKEIVHPDDQAQLLDFFAQSKLHLPRIETILRIKMMDGTFQWCRMIGYFEYDENGDSRRTIGVIVNINEEYEKSFVLNNLMNGIPGGVVVLKISDKIECRYFSDGFAELTHRTTEEFKTFVQNKDFLKNIFLESDYEDIKKRFYSNLKEDKFLNQNYRYKLSDGSIEWIHLTVTKIKEEDGCPIFYCIAVKSSDETELYRNIVDNSSNGVFVLEASSRNIIYINNIAKEICGFEKSGIYVGENILSLIAQKGKISHYQKNSFIY